jgi:hypothetical protein
MVLATHLLPCLQHCSLPCYFNRIFRLSRFLGLHPLSLSCHLYWLGPFCKWLFIMERVFERRGLVSITLTSWVLLFMFSWNQKVIKFNPCNFVMQRSTQILFFPSYSSALLEEGDFFLICILALFFSLLHWTNASGVRSPLNCFSFYDVLVFLLIRWGSFINTSHNVGFFYVFLSWSTFGSWYNGKHYVAFQSNSYIKSKPTHIKRLGLSVVFVYKVDISRILCWNQC